MADIQMPVDDPGVTRGGVTFAECLLVCGSHRELIQEYDRMTGSNLSFRGTQMDLAVDKACGRQESEVPAFAEFVREYIWLRLPVDKTPR